jgi:hypothetical protein
MAQSQFSPHTSFNRSPLVRLLASLGIAPVADPAQTFAETLSHWVAWTDAIALSGALDNDARRSETAQAADGAAAVSKVRLDLRRVRKELLDAIALDSMFAADTPGKGGNPPALPEQDLVALPLYRRQYQAHQRSMEERIGSLRARVRAVAATVSPDMRRLATLDGVLDDAMFAHQRRLLGQVPVLLERRFKAWARSPQASEAPVPPEQCESAHVQSDMPDLRQTMRDVLRAELDLRLQPVEGMMDAIGNTTMGQP